jgi:hypothetical protein
MTMRKERMQFETRRYKRFYKCECGAETSHFGLWTIAKRAAMEIKNYYDSVKISNK